MVTTFCCSQLFNCMVTTFCCSQLFNCMVTTFAIVNYLIVIVTTFYCSQLFNCIVTTFCCSQLFNCMVATFCCNQLFNCMVTTFCCSQFCLFFICCFNKIKFISVIKFCANLRKNWFTITSFFPCLIEGWSWGNIQCVGDNKGNSFSVWTWGAIQITSSGISGGFIPTCFAGIPSVSVVGCVKHLHTELFQLLCYDTNVF